MTADRPQRDMEPMEPMEPVRDMGTHEGALPTSGIIVPAADGDEADELASGTIQRGFDGDVRRLRRFTTVLGEALPEGTLLALRGSAVAGQSFQTGAPFDANGPGTSDLDLVVVGDSVLDLFAPDAQLLGGINTLPASDDKPWVAPELEAARRRAQALVRRPVSIQAMAGWFLDLRAVVQGQPYVILNPDE